LDIEIFFMNDTYLAKQSLLSTSGYWNVLRYQFFSSNYSLYCRHLDIDY
jgi:hypothetical protein